MCEFLGTADELTFDCDKDFRKGVLFLFCGVISFG